MHCAFSKLLNVLKSVDISILRRHTRSTEGNIGCVHMESFPGELQYVADGVTPDVCGLYLIGQPDELVQIEFQGFNVQCETGTGSGGLLAKSVDISILRRHTRSTGGNIGCVHMESFPGELQYVADGATPDVCGLYLIGQPDELVQIEFQGFNVQCETGTGNGGLLALFDGWELQGELFPDLSDHPLTMQERYTTFCGSDEPPRIFISSQNVALVQFMIPTAGQGFKVDVKFIPSPKPCNAVAMFEMGELTMKNYGMKRNCTTSIIYPEKIQLLNVDVGVTPERKTVEVEVGLTDKCMNYAGGDYIQLMNGNGLDTSMMCTRGVFCGMESNSEWFPVESSTTPSPLNTPHHVMRTCTRLLPSVKRNTYGEGTPLLQCRTTTTSFMWPLLNSIYLGNVMK